MSQIFSFYKYCYCSPRFISQHIKKKHGQDIICVARKLEDLINKHTKMQLDINFIKTCKREDLIPTFVKVNAAIKHGPKS